MSASADTFLTLAPDASADTVVDALHDMVGRMCKALQPEAVAEEAVLVEVLFQPNALSGGESISQSAFLQHLIEHLRTLSAGQDPEEARRLRVAMLPALCRMMAPDEVAPDQQALRGALVNLFFSKPALVHAARETVAVQNLLDVNGASQLVIDLITRVDDVNVFFEAVRLGIGLLQGGNGQVQDSMYHQFTTTDSTTFFERLRDKIAACTWDLRGDDEREDASDEHTVARQVLRYLQLLCENHNLQLQNFLREQKNGKNKISYNLVLCTIRYLDQYGLALYITEKNIESVVQALCTLTEYCQGPCPENQECITSHESNGLDIIAKELLLCDIADVSLRSGARRAASSLPEEMLLDLKRHAAILLVSVMESRQGTAMVDRVLRALDRHALISIMTNMYSLTAAETDRAAPCSECCSCDHCKLDVGHTLYLLASALALCDRELLRQLQSVENPVNAAALKFYAKNTAQIEIFRDGRLEKVVFPVPTLCSYLTDDTKTRLYLDTDVDEQGSKVCV